MKPRTAFNKIVEKIHKIIPLPIEQLQNFENQLEEKLTR